MSTAEMTKDQLKGEIAKVWISLGKDPEKLRFEGKNRKKLKEGLMKMRAVKMGLELLMNDSGASNLAIHLLADAFDERGK